MLGRTCLCAKVAQAFVFVALSLYEERVGVACEGTGGGR